MVWKISKKKEVTQKDIEQTALYGLILIIGLGILSWGIQHLQYIGQNMSNKTFKDFAEACWDTHKQVGFKKSSRTGKRVPNCVPKNEDNLEEKKVRIHKDGKELLVWDAELRTYQQMGWKLVKKDSNGHYLNELGPAAMKRLARKRAYAAKTMAKYGTAAKMGIPASKVNQRRNTPTRTK